MGKDIEFKLVVQGESREAAKAIDGEIDRLNRLKEVTRKLSTERQRIAQMERRVRFNSLSEEQKITRLKERQLTLEKQLSKARSDGNSYRTSAITTSLARTRFDLGQMVSAKGARLLKETLQSRDQSMREQASREAKAKRQAEETANRRKRMPGEAIGTTMDMLGGSLGGFGPAGLVVGSLAASVAGISYALKQGFVGAMEFSDEIGDTAEMLGSTRMEVMRMMKAAGAAGVRRQTVMGGLSSLAAARGAALSGDSAMIETFQRFGIGKSMLEGDASNLHIAQAIARSLGTGGMLATDRVPLGNLFGRRPEQTVGTLQEMERMGNVSNPFLEKSLQTMDEVNQKFDALVFKLKEASVMFSAIAVDAVKAVAPWAVVSLRQSVLGNLAWMGGSMLARKMWPDETPHSNGNWGAKRRSEDDILRTADNKPMSSVPTVTTAVPSMAVPSGDALARIGLYRGGIDPARADILRSQLETLRGIRAEQIRTIAAIKGDWI